MQSYFRMTNWKDMSKENVLSKLSNYRKDKRLQGFLRFKTRNRFKKLQTATRQLKIGRNPSNEMRQALQVF